MKVKTVVTWITLITLSMSVIASSPYYQPIESYFVESNIQIYIHSAIALDMDFNGINDTISAAYYIERLSSENTEPTMVKLDVIFYIDKSNNGTWEIIEQSEQSHLIDQSLTAIGNGPEYSASVPGLYKAAYNITLDGVNIFYELMDHYQLDIFDESLLVSSSSSDEVTYFRSTTSKTTETNLIYQLRPILIKVLIIMAFVIVILLLIQYRKHIF